MIDTIRIKLRYNRIQRRVLLRFFNKTLTGKLRGQYDEGARSKFRKATLGKWEFTLGDNYVTIRGSLTTSAKGNNIYNANHDDMVKAMLDLQRIFPLCLNEASFSSIDVAQNFIMKHPVFMYQEFLVCPNKYKLMLFKYESVAFLGDHLTFKFYDKVLESKNNRKLPNDFKKLNVFRFEISLNKKIHFLNAGLLGIRFGDLYDPMVYNQLVNLWFNKFLSLEKTSKQDNLIIDSYGLKGFQKYAVQLMLNTAHGREFTNTLLIDKNLSYKLRLDLKAYLVDCKVDERKKSPLVSELHTKVIRAYCDNIE